MRYCKKIIILLLLYFNDLHNQNANAQALNISGDTVYVNAEAEIQVIFPTLPKSFNTAPTNTSAFYSIKGVGTGITITAKSENTRPATLLVAEASRNHRFIIAFKKDINYDNEAELVYDFSTLKKIQEHNGRKVKPSKPVKSEPDVVTIVETPKAVDNSSKYYAFLEQGDKDFKEQKYEAAKVSFDKAHELRPDDAIPLQRLEEIKIKLAGIVKLTQQENDKKYIGITNEARQYLEEKKYPQAQEAYKRALILRPGDLYATHQLETIGQIIKTASGQDEQQKLKELYNQHIAQGEKAFRENKFTEAKIAYEQALVIKEDDALAISRLNVIAAKEKQQKAAEDIENNYNTAIQSADKLFQSADYNNAKTEYAKAVTYIKRPWPQDQIKRIDKILVAQLAAESLEKQKRAQQLETERREIQKQELENNYDAAIQTADKFFKEGDYDNAKIEYNKALDFIKKDWPEAQLKNINKIMAEQLATENYAKQEKQRQELENRYDAAMQSADKYLQQGDYANAKIDYNKAMSIIPRPLPQEQIKKINKIITDQEAQANAEKLRQAQLAEITARYNTLIKIADVEFDRINYNKAKKVYAEAAALKPDGEHAKERLSIIENIFNTLAAELKAKKDSIALALETNRKYNLVLLKGRSYSKTEDYLNAKLFYEEAANLKPLEEEPANQLKIINDKLREIARIEEINSAYDRKVIFADSLLIAKVYEAALVGYNAALEIKPAEKYPRAQIKYIQTELAKAVKREEIRKKEAEEQRYNDALARANKSVVDKRYEDAKSGYTEALSIHPDNDFAKKRLEIISYQLEKERAIKLREDSIRIANIPPPVKSKRKRSGADNKELVKKEVEKPTGNNAASSSGSTSYSQEELKRKYPNINFAALPPEQPINKSSADTKENPQLYNMILAEKPRLDVESSEQGIKLINQGINFEDKTAYFKFLVQNNSREDFLTGAMLLTWTRKQGNRVKLYPLFLFPSSLPVIKPASEAVVIYVCKTYEILEQETLSFELSDRFNKIKLQVNIPGSAYSQEWVRY